MRRYHIESKYYYYIFAYADYYIFNNGTLEEYEERLDEILKKI